MKRQIRSGVFETNSSSVHTITFDNTGLRERDPNDLRIDRNGKILVDFGKFGTEYAIYKRQSDKLSYLMTCFVYMLGRYCIPEEIYGAYEFYLIEKAVMKHCPECTGIKLIRYTDPYIDHQSVPNDYIECVNIYDEDEVINFIFNEHILLKTYHD